MLSVVDMDLSMYLSISLGCSYCTYAPQTCISLVKNILCIILDSIESNIEHAAVHVEEANIQLDRAKKYQVRQSLRQI